MANRKRMQFSTTLDPLLMDNLRKLNEKTNIPISKLLDKAIELLLNYYDKDAFVNQNKYSDEAYELLISNIIDIIEQQKRETPKMSNFESCTDLLDKIRNLDISYFENIDDKIAKDYELLSIQLIEIVYKINSKNLDITKENMYELLLNELKYTQLKNQHNLPRNKIGIRTLSDGQYQFDEIVNNKIEENPSVYKPSIESPNQMELLSNEELNDIQQSLNIIKKYRNKVIHEANSINSSESDK